ncbi:MAG TPA: hypothetical protein VKY57_04820 [Chitinispirillaceae bacterium]|nr:hypothetical protein [Chitinispirillaceae bacterium]
MPATTSFLISYTRKTFPNCAASPSPTEREENRNIIKFSERYRCRNRCRNRCRYRNRYRYRYRSRMDIKRSGSDSFVNICEANRVKEWSDFGNK